MIDGDLLDYLAWAMWEESRRLADIASANAARLRINEQMIREARDNLNLVLSAIAEREAA